MSAAAEMYRSTGGDEWRGGSLIAIQADDRCRTCDCEVFNRHTEREWRVRCARCGRIYDLREEPRRA